MVEASMASHCCASQGAGWWWWSGSAAVARLRPPVPISGEPG